MRAIVDTYALRASAGSLLFASLNAYGETDADAKLALVIISSQLAAVIESIEGKHQAAPATLTPEEVARGQAFIRNAMDKTWPTLARVL